MPSINRCPICGIPLDLDDLTCGNHQLSQHQIQEIAEWKRLDLIERTLRHPRDVSREAIRSIPLWDDGPLPLNVVPFPRGR